MNTTYVSTAEAKQRFSELVNQVFYGDQKVVVTSRGKPKVAIVSFNNTRVTRQSESQKQERLKALRELDQLYEEIAKETQGKIPDPVISLRKLRHDRDQQLIDNLH